MTIIAEVGPETSYTTNQALGGAQANFNQNTISAVASGNADLLRVKVLDWYTASNARFAVYQNTNLIASDVRGTVDGTGILSIPITSTAITAGDAMQVTTTTNGGYVRMGGVGTGSYYKDTTSTYATPSDPLPAGTFQGGGTYWWELSGTSGPTITSITDPISDSISITLSEAAPTVDTIEITVGTRTETQSYTTGDDTVFTIASISRATLPPIGTATVTLKAGATEIVSQAVELDPPTGYSAWVGASIDFTTAGIAYGYTGDLPVDGDILELSDSPNSFCDGTESASSWIFGQTLVRSATARVWQAATESWGATTVFGISGNKVISSVINGIMGSTINSVVE